MRKRNSDIWRTRNIRRQSFQQDYNAPERVKSSERESSAATRVFVSELRVARRHCATSDVAIAVIDKVRATSVERSLASTSVTRVTAHIT